MSYLLCHHIAKVPTHETKMGVVPEYLLMSPLAVKLEIGFLHQAQALHRHMHQILARSNT
eukprot:scaffold5781_cov124-Isochrysis_galbana.AAC.1